MTNNVEKIVINLGGGSKTKINMYDTIDDGYMIEVSYKKKGGRWRYAFGIPGTPENIKNAELIAINNAEIYLKGENK